MKTKFKDTEIGLIPEEWEVKGLKDHIKVIKNSINPQKFKNEVFCLYSVPAFDNQQTPEILLGEEIKSSKFKLPTKRILFPKLNLRFKRIWKIEHPKENSICSTEFFPLVNKTNIDFDFLYYLLKSSFVIDRLKGSADGTSGSHQRIKLDLLLNTFVFIPSLPEQTAIAKILSDLDSKIELLQKQNKTLEAIAQVLFKHWFVDFEFPNEEGKSYKSSGRAMVDSELGEIPRGWVVGMLGDICEITMGQSPPGKTYNKILKGTPFYQGNRDFGFRFPTRRVYCTAPTRFADEGNVLLSVRAPVGNLNVAEERCAIGRGVAALRLNGKQHGYLYYLLRATQSGWNKFEAEGTVFGSANKSDVHGFEVVIPPNKSKEQFASLIKSLDDQIINNEKQSRALTSIRDSLLPKLMSGKIRVPVEVK